MQKIYDTAIVGGGIAGYTAALTAKNLLLDYIWLGEAGFGDKLSHAEKITNFPSVTGNGAALKEALSSQMKAEGLVLTECRIDGIYRTGDFYTLTSGGQSFFAKTAILATGVETRGDLVGEREFLGRGLSYCAVCDGALYRGKRIAAVLYSEKFEEEAEYLARFAEEVVCFCLYAEPKLSGDRLRIIAERPTAIEGAARVERILTSDGAYDVSGVFVLKNSPPPRALAFGVETDGPHVCVNRALETNLAGLFAAGDLTGRPYQYAKAAGEGCVAAHSVRAYLRKVAENSRSS